MKAFAGHDIDLGIEARRQSLLDPREFDDVECRCGIVVDDDVDVAVWPRFATRN